MNLTIAAMGAKGEGAVDTDKGLVHVPFTLPGEVVNAAVNGTRGTLMSVLEASPDRIEPVCKHFEACGGCVVQHWRHEPMLDWKSALVSDALKARGINIPLQPIVSASPGDRRRVTFTVREEHGRKLVGFNAAHSHDVVEISECAVAAPQIIEALPLVRSLANLLKVKREGGHIAVTLTESGLDIALSGIDEPKAEQRRQLADFALKRGLARLSHDLDIILEPKKPVIHFGTVPVSPPSGGFLQASASVEEAMAATVLKHFGKAKKALDLFAGSGAFTFRLATFIPVHAIEGDKAAVASLDRGRRGLQSMKAITVEERDLFRRPLTHKDLAAYDAVIFDPPRAGAEDQSKWLAKSAVKKVAAVSCNPGTLARDVRILIDGGYTLKSVTPYDQFLWSAHVEAVALLER